jgi:hypothetical protein
MVELSRLLVDAELEVQLGHGQLVVIREEDAIGSRALARGQSDSKVG